MRISDMSPSLDEKQSPHLDRLTSKTRRRPKASKYVISYKILEMIIVSLCNLGNLGMPFQCSQVLDIVLAFADDMLEKFFFVLFL